MGLASPVRAAKAATSTAPNVRAAVNTAPGRNVLDGLAEAAVAAAVAAAEAAEAQPLEVLNSRCAAVIKPTSALCRLDWRDRRRARSAAEPNPFPARMWGALQHAGAQQRLTGIRASVEMRSQAPEVLPTTRSTDALLQCRVIPQTAGQGLPTLHVRLARSRALIRPHSISLYARPVECAIAPLSARAPTLWAWSSATHHAETTCLVSAATTPSRRSA